jgi:predicted phosphodiesterase
MRIAIISDLHEDHYYKDPHNVIHENIYKNCIANGVDLLIDAGDSDFPDYYLPIIKVKGNHYYYGKDINFYDVGTVYQLGGIKILATTLWMDFNSNDPVTMTRVVNGMNDFAQIKNVTPQLISDIHNKSIKFLTNNTPLDIVVTHHLPTFRSVNPIYANSPIKYGFASHLDWLIEGLEPKLWIHGHTHMPCDYQFNEKTRIVCNPRGYPEERMDKPEYLPVIIDI